MKKFHRYFNILDLLGRDYLNNESHYFYELKNMDNNTKLKYKKFISDNRDFLEDQVMMLEDKDLKNKLTENKIKEIIMSGFDFQISSLLFYLYDFVRNENIIMEEKRQFHLQDNIKTIKDVKIEIEKYKNYDKKLDILNQYHYYGSDKDLSFLHLDTINTLEIEKDPIYIEFKKDDNNEYLFSYYINEFMVNLRHIKDREHYIFKFLNAVLFKVNLIKRNDNLLSDKTLKNNYAFYLSLYYFFCGVIDLIQNQKMNFFGIDQSIDKYIHTLTKNNLELSTSNRNQALLLQSEIKPNISGILKNLDCYYFANDDTDDILECLISNKVKSIHLLNIFFILNQIKKDCFDKSDFDFIKNYLIKKYFNEVSIFSEIIKNKFNYENIESLFEDYQDSFKNYLFNKTSYIFVTEFKGKTLIDTIDNALSLY